MTGIFLVISNISTTAIISLLVTIVIFEMQKFSLKNFIIKASMITVIISIIIYLHPSSEYVLGRVLENFGDPE